MIGLDDYSSRSVSGNFNIATLKLLIKAESLCSRLWPIEVIFRTILGALNSSPNFLSPSMFQVAILLISCKAYFLGIRSSGLILLELQITARKTRRSTTRKRRKSKHKPRYDVERHVLTINQICKCYLFDLWHSFLKHILHFLPRSKK